MKKATVAYLLFNFAGIVLYVFDVPQRLYQPGGANPGTPGNSEGLSRAGCAIAARSATISRRWESGSAGCATLFTETLPAF
jgi:hypothetical protein